MAVTASLPSLRTSQNDQPCEFHLPGVSPRLPISLTPATELSFAIWKTATAISTSPPSSGLTLHRPIPVYAARTIFLKLTDNHVMVNVSQ